MSEEEIYLILTALESYKTKKKESLKNNIKNGRTDLIAFREKQILDIEGLIAKVVFDNDVVLCEKCGDWSFNFAPDNLCVQCAEEVKSDIIEMYETYRTLC